MSTGERGKAIDPTVRAILDDVVIQGEGCSFVDNYVTWIMTLRKLPPQENSRVFLQLAALARQFFDADCKPVATSLAALARIGLDRLVKSEAQQAPR